MAYLPFLLLTLLISSSFAGPLIRAAGQNGEACITNEDCIGGRICLSTETRALCSTDGPEICVCVPPSATSFCSSSADCDEGEICVLGVATIPLLSSTCISDRLLLPEANLIEFNEDLVLSGGSLAPCRTDAQCGGESSRCLLAPFGTGISCLPTFPNCACVPDGGLVPCSGKGDCAEGEACVELTGSDASLVNGSVCAESSVLEVSAFQEVGPSMSDEPVSTGLTFDNCLTNDDCNIPRQCLGARGPCEGNEGDRCACSPIGITLTYCGSDEDCEEGEACAQGSPAKDLSFEGNCVSASFLAAEDKVEPFSGNGNGVSFETCLTDGGCAEGLICFAAFGDMCNVGHCICSPPDGPLECSTSTDCLPRELCLKNTRRLEPPSCVTNVLLNPNIDNGFEEQVGSNKTLEVCTNDGDCAGSRACRTAELNVACRSITPNCVCRPRGGELRDCESTADCPGKEVCAIGGVASVTGGESKCVAESALTRFGLAALVEEIFPGSPMETPDTEPMETPIVLDPTPTVVGPTPAPSDESGFGESLPGESDVGETPESPELMEPPEETPGLEVSPEAVESGPSATPSPSPVPFVCVDAGMLGEFAAEELVFAEHAQGSVLCDGFGSCATDGHMVTWGGEGMMMRSYCERVKGGCVRRVMKVNSPKYRKGLRVASKTEGLEFTAFAAKYASRVEEVGLSALVRVGL